MSPPRAAPRALLPFGSSVPHSRSRAYSGGGAVRAPRVGEFLAPDGIIIRPIEGADSALTSVVVGVIPPRESDYPVHLHYGLEQVTVVLSGQLTALQRNPADAHHAEIALGPGDAI